MITDRGTSVEGDFFVVGVGIEPSVGWLEGSGVELEDGVVVDEYCRTNLEEVFMSVTTGGVS